ncbi:PMT1 [Candida pseudojiufengensis]|uniref:PMT1 n=1 Tax=Candida pseudojiufengensis TaxID=497109 RepID=UPI0022242970|nr:PMT1 [Candida pseudojiufengensis]KAI5959920.1 PMT1 [Candida pseudojiufengensis]
MGINKINKSPKKELTSCFDKYEYFFIGLLIIISIIVRAPNLNYPNSVVFDEVHFGGFARKYILKSYFMDVHPPLAKMLFAAVASIGGFNGNFEFKSIGDEFPDTVPYVFMRQFPALLGIGTVILCFLTLKQSGVSIIISFITSLLLIIENSNVTISRYILLDSPLLFFIAASVYAWKKFENQVPFSFGWYKALITTGVALGLAFSSKWVGLFTIAWVGFLCVYQLWFLIGDLKVSAKKIWGQFFARGIILLGIPIIIYLVSFAIHFNVLSKEGDGGAFMSSAFRAGLEGNKIPTNITSEVGLGSVITLRHIDTQGGYLHSHDHFYPTGSKQQQITLYPHLDSNNKWLIEPYNGTIYNDTFVPLINGMKIRLKHINSGRRLHSHDEKPPVSERDWQKECSCYGYEGFSGDANDDWIVEIVQYRTKDPNAKVFVKALDSIFRLRHAMTGNYLFSSEVKLPEWGFGQQEVTAASQGKRPLTHWYIETNENKYLPKEQQTIVNYPKLSLWSKFIESHKRMWKINSGLTEHHHWQSDPSEWPLLLRGINYWGKDHRQVYLLGNAVTWWATTIAIIGFITAAFITILKWHLGTPLSNNKELIKFSDQTFSFVLGWFLHYFPFFIMGRQLFLHHYLPALYFGILTLGHFFQLFTNYVAGKSRFLQQITLGIVVIFLSLSTLFYINYSPLIYGSPWIKSSCEISKPFKSWDYDCNNFLKNIGEYSNIYNNDLPKPSAAEEPQLDEAKKTPVAVPKLAKEEKHIESPPTAKQEAPKKVIEQLAPPEVKAETPKVEQQKPIEKPILEEIPSENPIVEENPAKEKDIKQEEQISSKIEIVA